MGELVYQRDSKKPLYVSTQVFRMLYLLGKSEDATGDEIADDILRQAIREQHPQLLEHLGEIERLEKELIKKLQKHQKHEKRNNTTGAAPVEGGAEAGGKTNPV